MRGCLNQDPSSRHTLNAILSGRNPGMKLGHGMKEVVLAGVSFQQPHPSKVRGQYFNPVAGKGKREGKKNRRQASGETGGKTGKFVVGETNETRVRLNGRLDSRSHAEQKVTRFHRGVLLPLLTTLFIDDDLNFSCMTSFIPSVKMKPKQKKLKVVNLEYT